MNRMTLHATRSLLVSLAGLILIGIAAWSITQTAFRPDLRIIQDRLESLTVPLSSEHVSQQSIIQPASSRFALQFSFHIADLPAEQSGSIDFSILDAGSGEQLDSTRISLAAIALDPQQLIVFQVRPTTRERLLHLQVSSDLLQNLVWMWASNSEAYPSGSLQLNGQNQPGDLAIRGYQVTTLTDLVRDTWASRNRLLGWLVFSAGIAILGLITLSAIGITTHTNPVEGIVFSTAAGIAILVIVPACLSLVRLRGPILNWIASLALIGSFWFFRQVTRRTQKMSLEAPPDIPKQPLDKRSMLLLGGMSLFALIIRLVQVHDLQAPLWLDGLIHTTLSSEIVDQGLIPPEQLYHTGFHSLVAQLHWLTGIGLPELTLGIGQWISTLIGLSWFILVYRLTGRHGAGLISAGMIWFISPFPAYLTTWSRYPFLFGLALLPLAITASMSAIQSREDLSRWLFAGLLVGSLGLVHYGMLLFWASGLIAWLLFVHLDLMHRQPATRLRLDRQSLTWLLGISVLILPIAIVGLARLASPAARDTLGGMLSQDGRPLNVADLGYLLRLVFRTGGLWLAAAGLAGALLAFHQKRRIATFALGWFFLIAVFTGLALWFIAPGLGNFSNLILFLPMLLALLTAPLDQILAGSVPLWIKSLICAGLLTLMLCGGLSIASQVNPRTVLFGPADLEAMQWIEKNTPVSAQFQVSALYWEEDEYQPADGGGWIPLFTGRSIDFADTPAEEDTLYQTVCGHGSSYIYLGTRTGNLDRQLISASPDQFHPLYASAGVMIYQSFCQP